MDDSAMTFGVARRWRSLPLFLIVLEITVQTAGITTTPRMPRMPPPAPISPHSSPAVVEVWDDVVWTQIKGNDGNENDNKNDDDDSITRRVLRLDDLVTARGGLGHAVFFRDDDDDDDSPRSNRNALEIVLDAILTELGDPSVVVEYWSRTEWKHIEAHADLDEYAARSSSSSVVRHPRHGHVLYVAVGTSVRGPTCLFPECTSGGDLDQELNQDLASSSSSNTTATVPMVSVPAVPGRLLRFRGDVLHAVPRPTDRWTLPFVRGVGETSPADVWGRTVVLFNTWGDTREDAPLGVETDDSSSCTTMEPQPNAWVRPRNQWRPVPVDNNNNYDDDDDNYVSTKVALLGDLARRNHTQRTVKLYAPSKHLHDALFSERNVYQTLLRPQP